MQVETVCSFFEPSKIALPSSAGLERKFKHGAPDRKRSPARDRFCLSLRNYRLSNNMVPRTPDSGISIAEAALSTRPLGPAPGLSVLGLRTVKLFGDVRLLGLCKIFRSDRLATWLQVHARRDPLICCVVAASDTFLTSSRRPSHSSSPKKASVQTSHWMPFWYCFSIINLFYRV